MITEVCLTNFKSIRYCNVSLGPLNLFVGPNGSGKSNFLDSLRFVRDGLQQSPEHAVRARGGWSALLHQRAAPNALMVLRLTLSHDDAVWSWEAALGAEDGRVVVRREVAHVEDRWFVAEGDDLTTNLGQPLPPRMDDRFYLVNAASLLVFRPLYDALRGMRFYHLNPEQMRRPQPVSSAATLDEDGANIASVVEHLAKNGDLARVEDYLSHVVEGLHKVRPKRLSSWVTLEFEQQARVDAVSQTFGAAAMSEGTLRALGVLVGTLSAADGVVGVEEPEAALHPAGVGLLRDALLEANQRGQVLVTTHSADLLDSAALAPQTLLAVHQDDGETHIGPIDQASRAVLDAGLYTAGELLRLDQLRPYQRLKS